MKNLLLFISLIILISAPLNLFSQPALYYSQDFESPVFPPSGWALEGTNPWSNDVFSPHTGSNCAFHEYDDIDISNDWLFTPMYSFTSGKSYRIAFFVKTDYYQYIDPEKLKITIGTAQNSSVHTNVLYDFTNLTYIKYNLQSFTYLCTNSGNYCFGIQSYTGTNGSAVYIDDVFIEEVSNVNFGTVGYANLKYSNSTAGGSIDKPSYFWINTSDFSNDLVFNNLDDGYAQLNFPPGKKFRFFDTNYTSVFIGTNGYITFGSGYASLQPQGPLPQPNDPRNMIAAAFTDLTADNLNCKISYKKYENRVVISCEKLFNLYSADYISYQITLYYFENPPVNSKFIICYNDELTNNFNSGNSIVNNAVVGINGPSGTQGHTYRFFGYRNPMFNVPTGEGPNGLALAYADINSTLNIKLLSSNSGIPSDFILLQNYPNPFNPATKIDFGLPSESFVSLSVYDLSGRLVKSIINEKLQTGWHSAAVNLSNLSSGVYFYKISALSNGKNYSESKRMVYIK